MKIIVCIKQVPDTSDIKWTENNTIQREGVESIINPYDVYALEAAFKLKKYCVDNAICNNFEITALTMGPLQAEDILKKAIALGCDNAILLTDKKFAGADTYATAKTLASAIKSKINDYDLIICGQFAIDGDTAQTGPGIATQLNIPQVTFVKDINKFDGKSLYLTKEIEEGYETVKAELPSLICVLKNDKEPARPTINGLKKAKITPIKIYSSEDIDLAPEHAGLKGSPTFVSKAFRPEHNRGKCLFCNSSKEFFVKINEFGGINE